MDQNKAVDSVDGSIPSNRILFRIDVFSLNVQYKSYKSCNFSIAVDVGNTRWNVPEFTCECDTCSDLLSICRSRSSLYDLHNEWKQFSHQLETSWRSFKPIWHISTNFNLTYFAFLETFCSPLEFQNKWVETKSACTTWNLRLFCRILELRPTHIMFH